MNTKFSASRGDAARVFVGDMLVGHLRRTTTGAEFTYEDEYVRANPEALGVAFRLPPRLEPHVVAGVNLHPFFAGLLPEGLRLQALVRRVKTSPDDLLSLLMSLGEDCIGDVSVTLDRAPAAADVVADVSRPEQLDFGELLERSLRFGQAGAERSAIPGVHEKISAAMISVPLRTGASRHPQILKLTPAAYPRLVENEAFFMNAAKASGLMPAETRLIHDKHGASGLLVKRFDRQLNRVTRTFEKLHQEDVCQLLDLYPADKYNLAASDLMQALEVTTAPTVERLRLLRWMAFAYAIANGDLHAKNVSILVSEPSAKTRHVSLSPAYDQLSTLPYGDQTMALPLDGRDKNLKGAHFVALGERHGVRAEATRNMLERLVQKLGPFASRLDEIGLAPKREQHLRREMVRRLEHLST